MLGAALVPLLLTLPPSITLTTQLVLALCISNSTGYCSSQVGGKWPLSPPSSRPAGTRGHVTGPAGGLLRCAGS